MLAGMGGVSMAPLVAAISNAGGLGIMGAANLSPDDLRAEIRKTQSLTKKPFAVDLLAPLPQMILPYLPVLYDEGVTIFVAGLAVPEKQVPEMKRHGLTIMVMTGKVSHATRAEAAGADIVAAQGTEAGGHTGEIGTLALVPQVVDAVKIPVVAAGGIVDGRGVVAALALGAEAAIIGTLHRDARSDRRTGLSRSHRGGERTRSARCFGETASVQRAPRARDDRRRSSDSRSSS
jgi:enoyl-[acyl-carrier protein] reductase II